MATLFQLLVIVSILVVTMGARIRRAGKFKPVIKNGPTPCTFNNITGICLREQACDAEHRIWKGGVVESEYDIRSVKCPYGYWCCYIGIIPDINTTDTPTEPTKEIQTTDIQTTGGYYTTVKSKTSVVVDDENNSNNYCLAPQTEVCPWCVLLYHSSSDQNAQHPFCLGALVSSKAIITASTCLITAKNKTLYAQLPNSSFPGKNYTILKRMFHPKYDTGTHSHDIGLLVMENDVTLQETQGACLDFVRTLEGGCIGYGFDINWKIYSTFLQVTDYRSCGKAGFSEDAACGTNADEVCLVEFGGPVLCPVDSTDSLVLQGIARGICRDNKVTLGAIAPSDRWIEDKLADMGIPKDSYTYL